MSKLSRSGIGRYNSHKTARFGVKSILSTLLYPLAQAICRSVAVMICPCLISKASRSRPHHFLIVKKPHISLIEWFKGLLPMAEFIVHQLSIKTVRIMQNDIPGFGISAVTSRM
jgi:hypothetical protein